MPESSTDPRPLTYQGGVPGALLPFAVFIGGVAWLALAGAPDERGFWPILLLALTVSLLLARDRKRWCETLLSGMGQPIVLLMIMAWLLAGVLASLLQASGFVESLAAVAHALGVASSGFVLAAFAIAMAVSTATGTSLGTLLLCAPLLYPAGSSLGAHPVVLMGALLGGATFGDNVSPVSDTTIASATSQGATMGAVVRSRLRYAVPAAAAAAIVYVALGRGQEGRLAAPPPVIDPRALAMLLAPALALALLFFGRHLIEGLLLADLAAVVLGLLLGRFGPGELVRLDPGELRARGLIADGLERGIGISIFTLLLMGLIATLVETGLLERLVRASEKRIATPRSAELSIFGVTSAAVLLTTHSVVAILVAAPFTREVGTRFGLSAARRANLLDITVCTYPFLLPYCIPTILAASLSRAGEGFDMPRLSALQIGMANAHSWALLLVLLIAIATGLGRTEEAESNGDDPP